MNGSGYVIFKIGGFCADIDDDGGCIAGDFFVEVFSTDGLNADESG